MLHTRINPANAEPVLSVRDLSVWRGERHLLNDVTWVVSPGERWVVLGANGSGKTTLVRVATWWDRPSAGELTLLGHTLGRADVRPTHARAQDASDPLHAARAAELTSLWRLAAKP